MIKHAQQQWTDIRLKRHNVIIITDFSGIVNKLPTLVIQLYSIVSAAVFWSGVYSTSLSVAPVWSVW